MSRFPKGQSGNPNGRPKGTKSAPNLIRDLLRDGVITEDDLREVVAVVVGKAKAGDLSAAGLLLDRTIPKLKPAADTMEEAELAEAIAAARIRGLRVEGGLTLEALVAASMDIASGDYPPTTVALNQAFPAASKETSTSGLQSPEPQPPTRRSIHIPMPPTDGDDPYNPM